LEGNVSISPINRQFIASQGIIKGVGSKLSNRKKSNKEMKQQPKPVKRTVSFQGKSTTVDVSVKQPKPKQQPKMVKGEMGGSYTPAQISKMKSEFAKSLQGQKDYAAKFQKMTPVQKAAEKKKFDASYSKLKKESAALNAKAKKK
jgi:hypothetical protein